MVKISKVEKKREMFRVERTKRASEVDHIYYSFTLDGQPIDRPSTFNVQMHMQEWCDDNDVFGNLYMHPHSEGGEMRMRFRDQEGEDKFLQKFHEGAEIDVPAFAQPPKEEKDQEINIDMVKTNLRNLGSDI